MASSQSKIARNFDNTMSGLTRLRLVRRVTQDKVDGQLAATVVFEVAAEAQAHFVRDRVLTTRGEKQTRYKQDKRGSRFVVTLTVVGNDQARRLLEQLSAIESAATAPVTELPVATETVATPV